MRSTGSSHPLVPTVTSPLSGTSGFAEISYVCSNGEAVPHRTNTRMRRLIDAPEKSHKENKSAISGRIRSVLHECLFGRWAANASGKHALWKKHQSLPTRSPKAEATWKIASRRLGRA